MNIFKLIFFKKNRGFTVLEFLVVIGIMAILMAMVLVGLSRARSHSRDQDRVAYMRIIMLGLEQFVDICNVYPQTLDPKETCDALDINNKTLSDILPELTRSHSVNISYAGIGDFDSCTGYHIGTLIEGEEDSFGVINSNYNSIGEGCLGNNTNGFNGSDPGMLDFKKNGR